MVAIRKTRSSDELRWQAESDAQTMATYQTIIGDKARMNRAIKVAKSPEENFPKIDHAVVHE